MPTLPPPLDTLPDDAQARVTSLLTEMRLPAGFVLFRAGDAGDGCYLIDSGEVRLEIDHPEVDSDAVLQVLGAGAILGELSLLDRQPRSASAIADSAVVARWLPLRALEALMDADPALGLQLVSALGRGAATKVREANARLSEHLFSGHADQEINQLMVRAEAAHRTILAWPDDRIDTLLGSIADAIANEAESLAQQTVEETGLGNVPDKTVKNRVASVGVLQSLLGEVGFGALTTHEKKQVTELAHPVGVIAGLVPMTNPVATAVFKTLIAIKGRNAIVLSFHRRAKDVGERAGVLMQRALAAAGAPVELVQWIRQRSSRRKSVALMAHPSVRLVLATGGGEMVRAAYSSGTPAIGVGPGNSPIVICEDANLDDAAKGVIESKSFDNGLICASESNLIAVASIQEAFVARLVAHGAAVLTASESDALLPRIVDPKSGGFVAKAIGQSAGRIAQAGGIAREAPIRLLVVPTAEPLQGNPLAGEKMMPMVSLFTVPDAAAGIDLARRLLEHQGTGHTCAIWTANDAHIEAFARQMPASRIFANSACVQGCMGVTAGLTPSFTLGCGTFGGNSTTDAVGYRNLVNVKRLARGWKAPEKPELPETPPVPQVVLVTGTSSGFGHALVHLLAERGHRVWAGMRDVGGRNARVADAMRNWAETHGKALRVVELDVLDSASVETGVATLLGAEGHLDVAVNNAGVMPVGISEAFSIGEFQRMLETNVVGCLRVNQAVLPSMRARRSGLLIQVSSIAGRLTTPFFSLYCASKYAAEAMAEGLRYELAPFGIDSVIVEPGPFATGLFDQAPRPSRTEVTAAYGRVAGSVDEVARLFEARVFGADPEGTDPAHVVRAIASLIERPSDERPLRTCLGIDLGVRELNAATEPFRKAGLAALGAAAFDGPRAAAEAGRAP